MKKLALIGVAGWVCGFVTLFVISVLFSIRVDSTMLLLIDALNKNSGEDPKIICENVSNRFNVNPSSILVGRKKNLFEPICEVPTSATECTIWKMVTMRNRPLFAFSFAGDFISFRNKFDDEEGLPVGLRE